MSSPRNETIPPHVQQTVESLVELHSRANAELDSHQRSIEWFTAKLGRPIAIYSVLVLAGAWIALNLVLVRCSLPPLDAPPFAWLQGWMSLTALLVTTMVLTTQNRQNRQGERHARLGLQVTMLVETEVVKLIGLVEELRRDLPNVPNRIDPVAEQMKKRVDPGKVLTAMETRLQEAERE